MSPKARNGPSILQPPKSMVLYAVRGSIYRMDTGSIIFIGTQQANSLGTGSRKDSIGRILYNRYPVCSRDRQIAICSYVECRVPAKIDASGWRRTDCEKVQPDANREEVWVIPSSISCVCESVIGVVVWSTVNWFECDTRG